MTNVSRIAYPLTFVSTILSSYKQAVGKENKFVLKYTYKYYNRGNKGEYILS